MKRLTASIGMVGGLLVASSSDMALGSDENPYALIAERNVFGLRGPAPPIPPSELEKELPIEVKLTGITTLMGNRQALLKVQIRANPPEPARSESYILMEGGPAEGGIEVVNVDVENERVCIRRSGKEEWLPLEKDLSKLAAPPEVTTVVTPRDPITAASARARVTEALGGASSGLPRPAIRGGNLRIPGTSGATLVAPRSTQGSGASQIEDQVLGAASGRVTDPAFVQVREPTAQARVGITPDKLKNLSPEDQILVIEAHRLQTPGDR